MDRLIHTPEGVRDVYNQECTKKLYLENQIEQVFHAFGYQDIETPTFEFFDVFGREVGTTPSRELYKFFDRDGNTLVLRPDFTPSIARAASMYFMEETMPIRLCYRGSSFVNSSSYQGRLKESTQMGVELLNDDSAMADAEIIAMTVKVMLDAGLTDFQISIGHVGFFQALSEEAALAEDVLNELKELISIKNHFGAEELHDRESQQRGQERTDDAGNTHGQTAKGTGAVADLECGARAHSVSGEPQCTSANGFRFDAQQFEERTTDDGAGHTREHNESSGEVRKAAERFGNAHSNRRRDRFRDERHQRLRRNAERTADQDDADHCGGTPCEQPCQQRQPQTGKF